LAVGGGDTTAPICLAVDQHIGNALPNRVQHGARYHHVAGVHGVHDRPGDELRIGDVNGSILGDAKIRFVVRPPPVAQVSKSGTWLEK
jgi:hypothetical protein